MSLVNKVLCDSGMRFVEVAIETHVNRPIRITAETREVYLR